MYPAELSEEFGGGEMLIAWQQLARKPKIEQICLSPKESPTLPRFRLEEVTGHHWVLRHQEALVRDHHHQGPPVGGRVPRRRRGRRGRVQGCSQHSVVSVRQKLDFKTEN